MAHCRAIKPLQIETVYKARCLYSSSMKYMLIFDHIHASFNMHRAETVSDDSTNNIIPATPVQQPTQRDIERSLWNVVRDFRLEEVERSRKLKVS